MSSGSLGRINVVASQGKTQVQGAAELRAALEAIGADVATKLGRRADRLAANEMRDVMKVTAPQSQSGTRSPNSKSYGHLKDNIRVRLARARNEGVIVYNVSVGKAFWGLFQEFGTKNQPAYPWMRPAFDASVQLAIDKQIDVLRLGIEKIAAKERKLGGRR